MPLAKRRSHAPGGRHLPLFTRQMDLGGQPAAGPPQPVISRLPTGRLHLQIPLFRAPAACWWARTTVESTDTSQVISPATSARACKQARIRAQVPSRCQDRNNPYTDAHGPYRSGTSRHGTPARVRHRIPSISRRSSHLRGRPGFFPLGSNGSSTAHCASVKSARPLTGTVGTRSPVRWSSWSLTHLPKTSLLSRQRHATSPARDHHPRSRPLLKHALGGYRVSHDPGAITIGNGARPPPPARGPSITAAS